MRMFVRILIGLVAAVAVALGGLYLATNRTLGRTFTGKRVPHAGSGEVSLESLG